MDLSHRIGPITQQLQWFYTTKSQVNIDILDTAVPEQNATFFRPHWDRLNYNLAYQVSEQMTARLIVNNLLNDQLLPQYGLPYDTVGRTYALRLDARF